MFFWANNVGYLGNNLLPARAGEIIRSAVVGKEGNINLSFAVATALTERIIDLVLLVIISIGLIFSLDNLPESIIICAKTMAIIASIGLIGIFFTPRFEKWALYFLNKFPTPPQIQRCNWRSLFSDSRLV